MSDKPTEADLARDLAADLAWISSDEICIHPRCLVVAAAAIRRALAGEAFKAYVHRWLDAHGVPSDPSPEHTAKHGCRVSGRLRWLLGQVHAEGAAHVCRLCKGKGWIDRPVICGPSTSEAEMRRLADEAGGPIRCPSCQGKEGS